MTSFEQIMFMPYYIGPCRFIGDNGDGREGMHLLSFLPGNLDIFYMSS